LITGVVLEQHRRHNGCASAEPGTNASPWWRISRDVASERIFQGYQSYAKKIDLTIDKAADAETWPGQPSPDTIVLIGHSRMEQARALSREAPPFPRPMPVFTL
jgi:hypothetical protein